ncbi:LysR family transcriptional regulator [Enterovirga rhinocerotis]|uniref:LysR family transcriptional regulator n=1 Tax=Enterovirga rhinocerotis TaxID=1339210 RepID=A0A4R7C9M1_9HYPH|nr:LysR family transcriptional regulator [Enterovirga rhinocerotis]TDR93457.1 LysR family transcriptional regulator [Enterovirga rhinocerotis]
MASFESFDWDNLKVFVQTARAGNLSAAAKRLRIDQSTVSRRVAQLESSLGSALFSRQTNGLRLTDLGERLLRHAERVESAVIALQEDISDEDEAIAGRVRLATMEGIASLYLARRLADLKQKHPCVQLELVTSPQTVYVNRREADLFLSFFRPDGRGLISSHVGRFRLYLYGSPGYLAERGVPTCEADLANHVYVSYIEDLIQVDAVKWLDDVVEQPDVVFHSNSMIAQMNAAAGGAGLVLLPEFAVEGRTDLVQVLPEAVSTTRDLWINVHCDLQYAQRIRSVARYLAALFAADPKMQAGLERGMPDPMRSLHRHERHQDHARRPAGARTALGHATIPTPRAVGVP